MNTLLRFTLAFVTGILLADWILLPPAETLLGAAILGVLLLLFSAQFNRYLLGFLWLLLAVGLGWADRHLTARTNDATHILAQPTEWQGYEARVVLPAESRRKTYKTEVEVSRIKVGNKWQSATGSILVYIDKTASIPQYGDLLLIRGTPRLVEPPPNPDQFDYRQFLQYRQIFHQQYLRTTDFRQTGQNQAVWYKRWAYQLSAWSNGQLKRLVPWPREYAVAKAMVLGLRDEMDPDLVQAYSVAGAVHVLSVSGFHIAIFVGILTTLLGFLKKRKRGQWLYLGLTLLILWFYAVLTGLSAPVIRSAVMFTIFLLAQPLGRKQNTENALFGSAFVLLLLDPLLLFSVSFQLSYSALAGIIFWQPALQRSLDFESKWGNQLWAITAVAFTAQLATFPLCVYYFNQFPVYFWLVNPAVMGLAFLQLPLTLATIAFSWVPFLAEGLGWATTIITWFLNQTVVWTEMLPFSRLAGLAFSKWEVILVYALMATLWLVLQQRHRRWLWATAALSLLLARIQVFENQQYKAQKLLVVHAVPRQTLVSLVVGQRALMIADTAFLNDSRAFDFYLDDFYTQHGIRQATRISLQATPTNSPLLTQFWWGQLLVWQGQRILFVEKPIINAPTADWIIVRKNAYRKTADLVKAFGSQRVVLDNSNKTYVLDNFLEEAPNLPYYFIHKKGALLHEW